MHNPKVLEQETRAGENVSTKDNDKKKIQERKPTSNESSRELILVEPL